MANPHKCAQPVSEIAPVFRVTEAAKALVSNFLPPGKRVFLSDLPKLPKLPRVCVRQARASRRAGERTRRWDGACRSCRGRSHRRFGIGGKTPLTQFKFPLFDAKADPAYS